MGWTYWSVLFSPIHGPAEQWKHLFPSSQLESSDRVASLSYMLIDDFPQKLYVTASHTKFFSSACSTIWNSSVVGYQ